MVTRRKSYNYFALDFIHSIRHHDQSDAASKNGHEQNYQIIVNLLQRHEKLIKSFFATDNFSTSDAQNLIEAYYSSDIVNPPGNPSVLGLPATHFSFLEKDVVDFIMQVTSEVKLFTEEVGRVDAIALLGGKPLRRLHSLNNTLMALFFERLADLDIVGRTWQTEVAKKGFIVSSSGKGFVSQHGLSASLTQQKARPETTTEKRLLFIMDKLYEQLLMRK